MSLTRSAIREKIRKHTNTTSATTGGYSDVDLNTLIDEAIIEIASVTHSRTASTIDTSDDFETVNGTRLYTFPTKLIKIYQVYYDGYVMDFAKIEDLSGTEARNWWEKTGVPTHWYIEEDKIGFYPIPNGAKLVKCWGIRKPDAITSDSDTPDLDEKLHPAIEWYCSREVWLDREDPNDMAGKCGARYNDKLEQYFATGHQDISRQDALEPDRGP